jgi:uncharacterized protein YfaS (alpha-2-macroglobulin family)
LTPERGVYRPGETAFLTTVVRTADRQLPPDVPVQLVVTDPRGTEYARTDARLNANGMYVFNVAFPLDALTGAYDVRLEQPGVPRPLGSTSLKVEEFMPDKLKVAVAPPAEDVAPGRPLTFTVRARQMFGPPAVNHRVASTVRFYSRIFSAPAYPDYVFQDANRSFSDESVDLGDAATDDKGEKVYELPIPEMKPPSALRAYIYSEVFDSGGRPVSAAGTVDVHVYPHYLGLKLDAAGPRRVGQDVKFNLLAVDPAGRPVTVEKARVVIRRKSWYSIFRAGSWGRNYYQSASYEEVVLNEMKDLPAKPTASVFKPTQEGEYTILLVGPSGMRSSVTVNILGSGSEPANLQTPQNLQIVLDKEDYKVGEEVTALVRAPFPGKLFLTVERERVYETRVIEMTGRETTVRLPVKPEYIPNMYVVGLIVRPPDDRLDTLPMESFGVVPLSVETKARAIPVAWDTPTVATSVRRHRRGAFRRRRSRAHERGVGGGRRRGLAGDRFRNAGPARVLLPQERPDDANVQPDGPVAAGPRGPQAGPGRRRRRRVHPAALEPGAGQEEEIHGGGVGPPRPRTPPGACAGTWTRRASTARCASWPWWCAATASVPPPGRWKWPTPSCSSRPSRVSRPRATSSRSRWTCSTRRAGPGPSP